MSQKGGREKGGGIGSVVKKSPMTWKGEGHIKNFLKGRGKKGESIGNRLHREGSFRITKEGKTKLLGY